MRSEQEMFDLILGVAREDNRIKAVYMNGSRANPKVKKDIFQDYDIVYAVNETESFIADENWINVFGEPVIIQEPDKLDKMLGMEMDFSKRYAYLMQFTDGNRIDLTLQTVGELEKQYGSDKLTVPLLDKAGCLPPLPEPSDEDYWVEKPTYAEYYSRCNEFWWVVLYCGKGLWRQEILYMADIMNSCVRKELMTLLSWYVGIQTDFKISIGKSNKYLKEYVEEDLWYRVMQTYNMGDYEVAWNALRICCELFEEIAPKVGEALGYAYNNEEAHRSFEFIKHIKELPADALEIY